MRKEEEEKKKITNHSMLISVLHTQKSSFRNRHYYNIIPCVLYWLKALYESMGSTTAKPLPLWGIMIILVLLISITISSWWCNVPSSISLLLISSLVKYYCKSLSGGRVVHIPLAKFRQWPTSVLRCHQLEIARDKAVRREKERKWWEKPTDWNQDKREF